MRQANGRLGSTAVHPLSCGDRQQRVESGGSSLCVFDRRLSVLTSASSVAQLF